MTRLPRIVRRPSVPAFTAAALLLTACASAPTTPIAPVLPAKAGITGIVHGGQQAVSGATIQLWAVGTAGDASAATPLLNPAVTTDANGNFNITGLYTCPTASSLVYLTGTGGNPGLTAGTNNPALAMMAALGTCGSLGASTYVTMNEVTTVGSVFALAPFMSSLSNIGYGSDLSAMTSAFNQINEFVNTATGAPGGPALPSGYGVSATQVNTLADLLATCINTNGSSASNTPCTNLFALTGGTSTTNAITSALYVANNPTANLTALSNLIPPTSPFQPLLASPPSSWTVTVQPQVATPTISPNGGTFTSSQTVTLADTTPNATIHYTLDGSTPTSASPTYSTTLTVASTETINAIASLASYLDSAVASASFTINIPSNSGIITTVVGNGTYGYSGDGGQATSAKISGPFDVAFDSSGNLYFPDKYNNVVRQVTPAGIISTFAGNGTQGFSGDGGQATSAQLSEPVGIAFDSSGNLYIADLGNKRIRKVTPAGAISTIAGTKITGYSGDGGQAANAELNSPIGLAVDSSGNLYIADAENNRIRMVTPAGVISTVAGNGNAGYSGDGGQATSAELDIPYGITVDSNGNLYIADSANSVIRKVTPAGVISTVAGNGNNGYSGDGGQATSAQLNEPPKLAVDSTGNLYIADLYNERIRKVTPTGVISTVAGNGTRGVTGNGGQATSAELNAPEAVTLDSSGNLYIADSSNYCIRKVAH
jgi:sugar lactone lactonase YvrE